SGEGIEPVLTLVAPADSATGVPLPVTLSWTPIPTAANYIALVYDDAGVPVTQCTASQPAVTPLPEAVACTPGGLRFLAPYQWTVVARNAAGHAFAFAPGRFRFTTGPPVVTLVAPAADEQDVGLRPTFRWSRPPGGSFTYEL